MNTYASYTDEQLLSLLPLPDEKAFTQLYDRYWKRLFALAFARLSDYHLAEEIVHDIFLDLWTRRTELRVTLALPAYLAVAVKYRVLNAQARSKARSLTALTDALDALDTPALNYLPFEELQDQLALYVPQLPERCRLTYHLSREHGLTQKEIAAVMQISEKAVEHNLSRALRQLRVSLKQFFFFW